MAAKVMRGGNSAYGRRSIDVTVWPTGFGSILELLPVSHVDEDFSKSLPSERGQGSAG